MKQVGVAVVALFLGGCVYVTTTGESSGTMKKRIVNSWLFRSSDLTGILGFWFVRPFPAPQAERRWHEHRFAIALVCTAIFNVVILNLVGQQYISGERWVLDDVGTAAIFGGLLSFVVAPRNAYYFGVKQAGG